MNKIKIKSNFLQNHLRNRTVKTEEKSDQGWGAVTETPRPLPAPLSWPAEESGRSCFLRWDSDGKGRKKKQGTRSGRASIEYWKGKNHLGKEKKILLGILTMATSLLLHLKEREDKL